MLKASKWNELPPETFDLVWVKLPFHDLCRLRQVCKAWNRMIREPYLKSLRLQIPRQPSCMLIMPKMVVSTNLKTGAVGDGGSSWGFLDMAAKRVYKLSHDGCIIEYINGTPNSEVAYNQYTMAADQNLMYVMCETRRDPGPQRHIICDPVTKACHDIPQPPTPVFYTNDIVVMTVERGTPDVTSYQIIRMEAYFPGKSGYQEVQVYDSATKQWTTPTTPLPVRRWSCSNIFWRGAFYALVVDVSRDPQLCREGPHLFRELYSWDLKTGRWSLVHVLLPPLAHPRDKSQLAVALGRMFVIEFIGPDIVRESLWDRRNSSKRVRRKYVIKVAIWEVVPGQDRLQKLAEMPRYPKYPGNMVQESQELYGEPVVAVGCGNSIVISSWIGRCVGFDLVKNFWHELPISNEKLRDLLRVHHKGIFAAVVDF